MLETKFFGSVQEMNNSERNRERDNEKKWEREGAIADRHFVDLDTNDDCAFSTILVKQNI